MLYWRPTLGANRVIFVSVVLLLLFGSAAFAQAQPSKQFPIEERWRHYVNRTYSWQQMALLGLDTTFDHALQEPHEWGRSPESLTYRYSSNFGRRVVQNSIELGAGILLREDTRFAPSQKEGFLRRVGMAATGAVMAQNERGNRRFSYARLAATAGALLVTSTWHPCGRSPEHLLGRVGDSYLGHLQNSLLTEFSPDMRRFGKKVGAHFFGR